MKQFKFEKDQLNNWYIILPEYPGGHEDLQMVCGADTMLDILAQGEDFVSINLSTDVISNSYLRKISEDESGAVYHCFLNHISNFEVWLCNVTKFVFGEFPSVIYLN